MWEFLLFALHFATDGRILFKVLPIVGILISASICLFDEAKIRQKAYFEENERKKIYIIAEDIIAERGI